MDEGMSFTDRQQSGRCRSVAMQSQYVGTMPIVVRSVGSFISEKPAARVQLAGGLRHGRVRQAGTVDRWKETRRHLTADTAVGTS